jgi:nucleoside-diphosphate-sugar epimerase
MRILVTGARGKVGAAAVAALVDAGHDVTASDLGRPRFEADRDAVAYRQADLTEAGDAFAIVPGHDAVVHAAAIPDPTSNAPHTVFRNNLMAVFNTLEAAIRFGVPRFVNISSARGCPTTSRSTSSTRSARRTRTRPRSTSASS